MPDIPLVKARYVTSFARAIERCEGSIARPLQKAGLDERVLAFSENYIPMSQLHAFASTAAVETGNFHLGLDAGISPRESHSDFSRELALAPKLYDTLQALINDGKTEDTTATFRVISSDGYAWLTCGRVRGDAESARQIELYRYGALLEVIRYAAGPDWLPPRLRLQSCDDGKLKDVPLIQEVDVDYGNNRLAIAMDPNLLGEPLKPDDPLLKHQLPIQLDAGPTSFDAAVREVIDTHVRVGRFNLTDLADAVQITSRTLQRYLAEAGTTFSDLLENARIGYAQEIFRNTDASMHEVSDTLGYSHSTHFSRAFRRAMGISPGEYRRTISVD